jgi:hypothetical protein
MLNGVGRLVAFVLVSAILVVTSSTACDSDSVTECSISESKCDGDTAVNCTRVEESDRNDLLRTSCTEGRCVFDDVEKLAFCTVGRDPDARCAGGAEFCVDPNKLGVCRNGYLRATVDCRCEGASCRR